MKRKANGKIPNKKVIRKENKAGDFTTVDYKILRNKNLTSNAKILLIEILSDTDKFRFSETLFLKRMNIAKSAYYNAINSLIKNGYLRKSKIKNTQYNYYTVSEYGNLSSNESSEEIEKEKSKKSNDLEEKLQEFLLPYIKFLSKDVVTLYHTLMGENKDFYSIKSALDKAITKEKKKYFKQEEGAIMNSSYNPKTKVLAVKLLKEEIFEKNNKVEPHKMNQRACAIISRRRPLDRESLLADKYDGV